MRGVERRCRSIRVARADLCCVLVRWIVKGRILITPVPQPENSVSRERILYLVTWLLLGSHKRTGYIFGKKAYSPLLTRIQTTQIDVSYIAILGERVRIQQQMQWGSRLMRQSCINDRYSSCIQYRTLHHRAGTYVHPPTVSLSST